MKKGLFLAIFSLIVSLSSACSRSSDLWDNGYYESTGLSSVRYGSYLLPIYMHSGSSFDPFPLFSFFAPDPFLFQIRTQDPWAEVTRVRRVVGTFDLYYFSVISRNGLVMRNYYILWIPEYKQEEELSEIALEP